MDKMTKGQLLYCFEQAGRRKVAEEFLEAIPAVLELVDSRVGKISVELSRTEDSRSRKILFALQDVQTLLRQLK